jgi:fucose 4-O-acetylase-like acetyltransferase
MNKKQAADLDAPVARGCGVRDAGQTAVDADPIVSSPGGIDLRDRGWDPWQPVTAPSALPTQQLRTGTRTRELPVETLRGLAIVLMVMGHVIGSKSDGGLRVSDDSWYRYFYLTLSPLRMPLFTVISGYVYACRPVAMDRASSFLAGKCRRLLLPLVSVSTVQYLFSVYGPGVSRPQELAGIWRVYFFPFDQFWFLQAIALVFLTAAAMELSGALKNKWGWSACLLIAAAVYLSGPAWSLFSINGWGRLLVFFILGVGIKRFDALSRSWLLLGIGAAVFAVSTACYQSALLEGVEPAYRMRWITLACGLAGTFLLFRLRFTYRPLAWLGGFAFSIYLLHSFGVAASRTLGMKILGITQTEILLAACLVLGLALPIAGHKVLERFTLTRRVFLGLR